MRSYRQIVAVSPQGQRTAEPEEGTSTPSYCGRVAARFAARCVAAVLKSGIRGDSAEGKKGSKYFDTKRKIAGNYWFQSLCFY